MYEYRATIIKVVDGDTVHADVDLGFDTHMLMTIRLAGIDAPEMGTPLGPPAKAHLAQLIDASSDHVVISTVKDKKEKFGRYLGYLTAGGVRVNDQMVRDGFAVPYDS